jgi:hypothetical protein
MSIEPPTKVPIQKKMAVEVNQDHSHFPLIALGQQDY